MAHSLVQSLRSIADFSTLDERSLLTIVGESMNLFWKAGSHVFRRGAPGEALYIILSGEIAILDERGQEVVRLGPGDSFGELSLLLNTSHRRDAIAITDSELVVFPKEAFIAILERNPPLARHFDEVLRIRYREAVAEVGRS
ncbi:MAG: cyclic nucleotide-binding domain-containing protein [Actinomycetota bacterium]